MRRQPLSLVIEGMRESQYTRGKPNRTGQSHFCAIGGRHGGGGEYTSVRRSVDLGNDTRCRRQATKATGAGGEGNLFRLQAGGERLEQGIVRRRRNGSDRLFVEI